MCTPSYRKLNKWKRHKGIKGIIKLNLRCRCNPLLPPTINGSRDQEALHEWSVANEIERFKAEGVTAILAALKAKGVRCVSLSELLVSKKTRDE